MTRPSLACLALLSLVACGDSGRRTGDDSVVRIAVASNFVGTMRVIADAFERATGFRTVVSSGSTGKLYAQILNGAPYDVFLAADSERPALLESEGFAARDSRFSYAEGRLALFSTVLAEVEAGPDVLATDRFAHLAIANPRTAPYGRAARDVLDNLGVGEALRDRIVKGSNVIQALQLVESGGAELGFVAYSQVLSASGHKWLVPADLHAPIRQDAVLLVSGRDNPVARAFLTFLQGEEARTIIAKAGYGTPRGRGAGSEPEDSSVFEWGPLLLSFRLAAVTTVILLLLGTPLAWWLTFTESRWRHAIAALTAMPLVMPPTVLGFYLLLLLGPDSPVGWVWEWTTGHRLVFSFAGLVVASVIYSLPFVVQPLHNAFTAIGPHPLEAASVLGAGPWDRFRSVALPLAARGFVTASTLGFAHTLGEFGVVLMIGGNVPGSTRVVSIAIYDHVEALDYQQAHVLSACLLLFSFATLFVVYTVNHRRTGRTL